MHRCCNSVFSDVFRDTRGYPRRSTGLGAQTECPNAKNSNLIKYSTQLCMYIHRHFKYKTALFISYVYHLYNIFHLFYILLTNGATDLTPGYGLNIYLFFSDLKLVSNFVTDLFQWFLVYDAPKVMQHFDVV